MVSKQCVYFDYAASSKISPNVISKVHEVLLDCYGNPSSKHSQGYLARKVIEDSRVTIAQELNCDPRQLIFTSGATESNNLIVNSICLGAENSKNHIITSRIEHKSILEPLKRLESMGFEITYLEVDKNGHINPQQMENAINARTCLITIGYINNEIGSVQDIEHLANIAHNHGVFFHSDVVQAFMHYPIDVSYLNLDAVSVSGHKFGSFKGSGFLYCKDPKKLLPMYLGGGQEGYIRAGTENIAGILSMKLSIEDLQTKRILAHESVLSVNKFLREKLISIGGVFSIETIPVDARIFSVFFPNFSNEGLMNFLDIHGIYVSASSACTGSLGESSHVLKSLGFSRERIDCTIRISFSHITTINECELLVEQIRQYMSFRELGI